MNLDYFKEQDNFYKGLQTLFSSLNIPVNYIDENPLRPQDILSKTYKDTKPAYQLMDDVYFLGMVDDKAFEGAKSAYISEIKKQGKDYDGILIFGVTLTERENGLLPTRTQLAEITRAFNHEFYYTPVVVIFRYNNFISLANVERQKYKQEWREGEKAGKVSILRDIEIENPHTGHLKILEELKIKRSGKKGINSFEGLYLYWQEVFSVNLLNKKFYSELSNWYFWAVKHVTFPSEPTIQSLFAETGSNDNNKLEAVKQEFKAKNVIRLLTRLLFVWFIKEKKLIPEDLFNLEALQKNILKKISPVHEKDSLFKEENKESIYYKAILQNLFFATLNCPIDGDGDDKRKRGFRLEHKKNKKSQKSDFGVLFLMRYKKYFKHPDAFLEMVNKTVPFLNGGLFECLDIRGEGEKKEDRVWIEGFSENIPKEHNLIVPDYLFFGSEEKTDLSSDYGTKNRGAKEAGVKGLINILKSYKFTIAENTPIEEDVALDPELLGKVFENLLASYNPETKTTARKQTGSFYTPREIVNYMVDESLIAHLKNSVSWDMEEQELDEKLHKLLSFDPVHPFEHSARLSQEIIHSLDNCKILDPACGSGAFPMGILQKMVHILQKVDPENKYWQELQLEKAEKATKGVFAIKDKEERKQLLDEINEAFDETINNPDYARKLFLIENCIYGVDIQPIAAQISKLRFFISLVVEQKVNKEKDNFGIRPLPNLETKFVTANTLIGIEKPKAQMTIFDSQKVKDLEQELKTIRHKLFGAKTKATKVKYRKRDEELRNEIAEELKRSGWVNKSAEQLAGWDPYDQNGVSPFFDPEWMFDIKEGFDVVIGNPPYMRIQGIYNSSAELLEYYKKNYKSATGRFDLYCLFTEKGYELIKNQGQVNFIMPFKWTNAAFGKGLRTLLSNTGAVKKIISFSDFQIFTASTYTSLIWLTKNPNDKFGYVELSKNLTTEQELNNWLNNLSENDLAQIESKQGPSSWQLIPSNISSIFEILDNLKTKATDVTDGIYQGIVTGDNKVFVLKRLSENNNTSNCYSEALNRKVEIENEILHPILTGKEINQFNRKSTDKVILYPYKGETGNTVIIDEETLTIKYPLAYHYLVENYKRLSTRGSKNMKYPIWYALWNQRKINRLNKCNKILTPDVCHNPQMWLDNKKGFFHIDTSYAIIPKNQFNDLIYPLYAIFNSTLMWFFLKNTGAVLRGGFFRFKTSYIKNFPLPEIEILKNLKSFFRFIILIIEFQLNNNTPIFELFKDILNSTIYELYFPDHMKERKIDILQFVEKDIEEVMQGNEFETLDDTQKEQVITELHNRWSDPNSEIVKRMNSFSEKSPEILKPILESSK